MHEYNPPRRTPASQARSPQIQQAGVGPTGATHPAAPPVSKVNGSPAVSVSPVSSTSSPRPQAKSAKSAKSFTSKPASPRDKEPEQKTIYSFSVTTKSHLAETIFEPGQEKPLFAICTEDGE